MKKILTILLVLIFLFNSAGYYLVFIALRYQAKWDMERYIAMDHPGEILDKIVIPRDNQLRGQAILTMLGKKEFRYKGKMYDVAREVHKKDFIIYYVLNDVKEEHYFSQLSKSIRSLQSNTEDSARNVYTLLYNVVKQVIVINNHFKETGSTGLLLYAEFLRKLIGPELKVPTPPPKLPVYS